LLGICTLCRGEAELTFDAVVGPLSETACFRVIAGVGLDLERSCVVGRSKRGAGTELSLQFL